MSCQHLIETSGVIHRNQRFIVGEASSGQKFHALFKLVLGDKFATFGVHEAQPEVYVLHLGGAVVAEQGRHAQELDPGDVHLLLVLRVDAHGLENGGLDDGVLVFQQRARVEEEVHGDALVNGGCAGTALILCVCGCGGSCLLVFDHLLLHGDVQHRVILGVQFVDVFAG